MSVEFVEVSGDSKIWGSSFVLVPASVDIGVSRPHVFCLPLWPVHWCTAPVEGAMSAVLPFRQSLLRIAVIFSRLGLFYQGVFSWIAADSDCETVTMYMYHYFGLIFSVLTCPLLATNCYNPVGQLMADPSYEPCNPGGGVSMCCAMNRSKTPDQCLPNGLCTGGGNLYRDSCTDPTWKSPSCLQLCTVGYGNAGDATEAKGNFVDYSQSDVQVTHCNDGSYCCGSGNTTCCDKGQGKHIASILQSKPLTSSAPPTSSVPSTTSIGSSTGSNTVVTVTAVPNASQNASTTGAAVSSKGSSGLDQKAKIGIAVSCSVVGFAIVTALTWLIFVRNRARFSDSVEPAPAHVHEVCLTIDFLKTL